MYDIKKIVDVKLNVQLVYVALIHQYVYEGPCRFGPEECLTTEFDEMNQAEIFKMWSGGIGEVLSKVSGVNMPTRCTSRCQMNTWLYSRLKEGNMVCG
ncbi:hypothetical protein [Eubacterium oxidoreducens]|uniref:Uncharacterized protein n=1 Tax=Eubacterium oxidoreducens TaxID=1732 RepID=A0A1G6CJ15_EUBOX|nr:hypothetical protein [Eubacterium oxidoreducens]SDB32898.1 hypothetical protein SAMN02910417_02444 [Eubacterium oxidoreducens]